MSSLGVVNRYNIIIDKPGLQETPYKFLAKGINLPGLDLQSTARTILGLTREPVSGIDYDLCNITFTDDNKLSIRKVITGWMKECFNSETGTAGFFNDYVKDMTIEILNRANEPVLRILIESAYPKSMSETILGFDRNDQPFEFTAAFKFYRWKPAI